MALDGTYAGLQASIAAYLNRADLATNIPDFITLAEAQMARRFVSRFKQGMDIPRRLTVTATPSIASGDEYVPVPDGLLLPLLFTLNASPPIELGYTDVTNIAREKQLARWTGAPKWYAVAGANMQLFPVADQAYTGTITYVERLPAISESQVNWVLTDYPDAYLYGAAVQAWLFLRDEARAESAAQAFVTAVDDICSSDPLPPDAMTLRSDVPRSWRWPWQSDPFIA